jgi:hypothetical protein
MTFSIIRSWAKSRGYSVKKEINQYCWSLIDNNDICGVSKSVSKLARDIFNHITDNRFVEHQNKYKEDKNG